MGDEVHNRNVAASSLLIRRLVPAPQVLGERCRCRFGDRVHCRQRPLLPEHLDGGVQEHARRRARRGRQQHGHGHGAQRRGVRHPRERPRRALVHRPRPGGERAVLPAYTIKDAAPDLGDSAITETAGLGGFAMAAAPAIVKFVGGTPQDALANTLAMTHITLKRNGASRCRRSISPARRRASTCAGWSTPGCCRSSIPASRTRSPASARSAPASRARRSPASPRPWRLAWS